ncbi:DUF11 domain-containing protein [Deinococcus knuensis]|uniref:DUF11 domain-containing protein n=1 Tax=Deinococcus knuensis TaxID=1837380 RepID=A0ABQ2SRC9_9DEIO|nr:DUF11 domain-containing protein [Deinococcus knuensis]GGS35513.1 hypothetical protein GCM10008961_29010 [Deinococcus knuensis]
MSRPRALALLTLGLGGAALAQDASLTRVDTGGPHPERTTRPVTSVGQELNWSVGDDSFTLQVHQRGPVTLQLYSAGFDPQDYRRPDGQSLGDERYGGLPVESTFTLLGPDGQTLRTLRVPEGASDWVTAFDGTLEPGTYTLKARTQGRGKNTFAARIEAHAASLSATRVNVTVRGPAWTPALTLNAQAGDTLRLYDGDGPAEMEVRVTDENGVVTPLPISGQLEWVDLPLPGAGTYRVELRQPPGAAQYSNTAGLAFTRGGADQRITLAQTDRVGQLRVQAQLVQPGGEISATTLNVTVGDQPVTVPGEWTAEQPAGTYPLSVQAPAGATVSAPDTVTVPEDGLADVTVQVRPELQVSLTQDRPVVCVGDVVTFRATVSTDFDGTLNAPLDLKLPAGLSALTATRLNAAVRAGQPATLEVVARADTPGGAAVTASAPGTQADAALNVSPHRAALQLRRAALPDARPGDTVTVALHLNNTSAQPTPYLLSDTPGEGLSALDSPEFEGTLRPGESRTLTYRAQVTAQSGELTPHAELVTDCTDTQTASGRLTVRPLVVPTPEPAAGTAPAGSAPAQATVPAQTPAAQPPAAQMPATPASLPPMTRVSDIHASVTSTGAAQGLIYAQRLPDGATYLPGSARYDALTLPDPLVGPSGTLYWTLPAHPGELRYSAQHEAALPALSEPTLVATYGQQTRETLRGSFDPGDFASAQAPDTAVLNPDRVIQSPPDGQVYRDRDQVTVIVQGPGDVPLDVTLNGEDLPSKLIGTRSFDPASNLQRLEYVGVRLKPGQNVIEALGERTTVTLAGRTTNLRVLGEQVIADGVTPIRLRVQAVDERGVTTALPFLTVRTTLEPTTPDANPMEAGYQVRLRDGEGVLEFAPQAAPVRVGLDADLGDGQPIHAEQRLEAGHGTVAAGLLSATLSGAGLNVTARGTLEAPLGGGHLIAVANTDGLPAQDDPGNNDAGGPYAARGDRSAQTVPLTGQDPAAFQYDHADFTVAYRQGEAPIETLLVPGRPTALSVVTHAAPGEPVFTAFAAGVSVTARTETLTPDGTRLLRLSQFPAAPGSDTLDLIVSGPDGDTERRLTRGQDYTLDAETGLITLATPLAAFTVEGGLLVTQSLRAAYRLEGAGERQLAFGAEVRLERGDLSLSAATVTLPGSGAGSGNTTAVRATYGAATVTAAGSDGSGSAAGSGALSVTSLAAVSGGKVNVSAAATGSLPGGTRLSVSAAHQSDGYAGLNAAQDGTHATASAAVPISGVLSAQVAGEFHDTPTGAGGEQTDRTRQAQVSAGVRASLNPVTLGLGVKSQFGQTEGTSLTASAGYHAAPVDVDVTHAQPLTGNVNPQTTLSARYQVTRQVAATLGGTVTWPGGSAAPGQALSLGLESRLGGTNLRAAYELPTAGGGGNRARFGADTTLPVTERLSASFGGGLTQELAGENRPDPQREYNLNAALRYKDARLSANGSSDFSVKNGQLRTVLRGGASLSVNDFATLNVDALSEFGPSRGDRFTAGGALRKNAWQGLLSASYERGSLSTSGAGTLLGSGELAYHAATWAMRGGLAVRAVPGDPGSLTVQPSLSGSYYLGERFAVGAALHTQLQPATGVARTAAGIEGSLRALPGTWLTLGYNFTGFDSISTQATQRGAYLRLDISADERIRSLLSGAAKADETAAPTPPETPAKDTP